MKVSTKKRKGRTILSKMLIAMTIILFVQTTMFITAIFLGGAFENLDNSSFDMLQKITDYRKSYLEKEVINRWMNLDASYDEALLKIDETVNNSNKTYTELINGDVELSTEVINNLSETLLKAINTNSVSGTFIVLGNVSEKDKYGLYFHDTNKEMSLERYSDIRIEVCPLGFVNNYNLIDSSSKSRQFRYKEYSEQQKNFFVKPINAKTITPKVSVDNCGWWSTPFILNDPDMPIITYTVPLVNSAGVIFGIYGIEVSVEHLQKLMPCEELDPTNKGFYILAKEENGEILEKQSVVSSYNSTPHNNSDEIKELFKKQRKNYSKTSYKNIFQVSIESDSYYLSQSKLQFYDSNTPFADESWILIGVVETSFVHAFSLELRLTIYVTLIISVLLAIGIIVLSAYFITKPVARLTNQVKTSTFFGEVQLDKTNIKEIDELIVAIEALNKSVIDSESKLMKIIDLVNLPVVAFEHNYDLNTFYTSKDISEFLLFNEKEIKTIEEFTKLFTALEEYRLKNEEFIYKYIDLKGNARWVEARYIGQEQKNAKMGILIDMSNEYIERESLLYERNIDSLTNILNRRAFLDEIEVVFSMPEIIKIGALIMLDLDDLKFINDNYGHGYGDEYIQQTAKIIINNIGKPSNQICGRRSGDEFYIFIYGFDDVNKIDLEINRLKNAFDNSVCIAPDGTSHQIRVSAGISIYPDDETSYQKLIKYADYAMYEIKNSLKGEFKYFERKSYEENAYLLHNKEELNNLIDNELIDFHFQAIISLKDGSILGYEGLMRSLLASFKNPGEILNVAKSQFKLSKIERLTFLKTLEKYDKHSPLFKNRKIFINSIANQRISDEGIATIEEKYGKYLKNLVIEFTENEKAVKSISDHKCNFIARWHGQIALDDYGTGFNGEVSLLESKPDYVKIDMSLVRNINLDLDRQQMVNNIVSYTKNRGIKTIAEGVETKEELETVIKLGCDYVQGYYLLRPAPLPVELSQEMTDLIKSLNKKN